MHVVSSSVHFTVSNYVNAQRFLDQKFWQVNEMNKHS